MLELVKRSYRVLYQVDYKDKPITCTIKTADLKEVHRVLVQMTGYCMPTADWHDLVVHDITDENTKEYTQMYISAMYDDGFHYKAGGHPDMIEDSNSLFGRAVSPVVLKFSTIKESACFAPWMGFKEA